MAFDESQPRDEKGMWTAGDAGPAIQAAASGYKNPLDGSNRKVDYSHQQYRYKILSANLLVKKGKLNFHVDNGSGSTFRMQQGTITRPEATKLKFSMGGADHILNDSWSNIEPFIVKHKIILP